MFKQQSNPSHSATIILLIFLLFGVGLSIPVSPSTFCISNCYSCPISPYQCPYIESILNANQNHNCLPFSNGRTCQVQSNAFQKIQQDSQGVNGWRNGNQVASAKQTCTLYHQPESVGKFGALGPFTSGTTLTKSIPINRDIVDAIVLKMSFVMNAQNIFKNQTTNNSPTPTVPQNSDPQGPPDIGADGGVDPGAGSGQIASSSTNTISNITNRSFVDILLSLASTSYRLQLNYPTRPSDISKITNSTCGIQLQYIHIQYLPQPLSLSSLTESPSLSLQIQSLGDPTSNATWGLVKFQIFTGCGGLLVSSGGQRCRACIRGYFAIRSRSKDIEGCEPCPVTCTACNSASQCTLCQVNTAINPESGVCEYPKNYTRVGGERILTGSKQEGKGKYFENLVQVANQNNQNVITMETTLRSPAAYKVIFYLLYNSQFIQSLGNDSVKIYLQGQNLYRQIPFSQFTNEIGIYDERLNNALTRYYVKKIQIDKFNEVNQNKVIQVSVRAPPRSRGLFLSNYQLVQYQCTARCVQCDQNTNQCLQCDGFFINRGTLGCIQCANGFFLQVSWDNKVSNTSLQKASQDICVKCHSTCKQCIGPEMTQCTQCFKLFTLSSISFNTQCIECLIPSSPSSSQSSASSPTPQCLRCRSLHPDPFTSSCLICTKQKNNKIEDLTLGQICKQCWLENGLAYGRCIPTTMSGLVFYGSDVVNGVIDQASWTGQGGQLRKIGCGPDYQQLWGVGRGTGGAGGNGVLRWEEKNLPAHTGLYIIFNIFKLDIEPIRTQNSLASKYPNITIKIRDNLSNQAPIPPIQLLNKKGSSNFLTPGSNICSQSQNQMIHTFSYDAPKHTSSSFQFQISSQGSQIYIRQLQLYLGNCNECFKNNLNYQVKYMPRYSYNATVSPGIDVWIQFNKKIEKGSQTNLENAFQFEIDKMPGARIQHTQFRDQIQLNNRVRYFLPIDQSFANGTLRIKTNPDARIFGVNRLKASRRMLINSPLNILQNDQLIHRFTRLSVDDLVSTNQLYWFFNFFQWFALITMIVCAFFGIGVVFQQFSIMLQLLFLHVYISSPLLPASYKAPMSGLSRMEHLNYFADPHARGIEQQWFGNYEHPSPYVFQQYNKDILFQRSFYPTIIINLIYLGWFLILYALYRVMACFKSSKNYGVGFLRHIPARPLNYIDQIWRYQFITTMWAAFMQFHILKNDTAWQRLNLALCFISFIISIIWPFFVVCYTYRLNKIKYTTDFMYKYEDIYYKKMQTISENKLKYYYYVFIRFGRYFLMTLFICLFTEHEIIAPVILICLNVIEIIYVLAMRIFYKSHLGTAFKVIENLLFIGIEVALLFVYGLADTIPNGQFVNLGYAIIVMGVIMVILGLGRVGYYLWSKLKGYRYKMKLGGQDGEVVKYGQTPLPGTQRGDFVSNQIVV